MGALPLKPQTGSSDTHTAKLSLDSTNAPYNSTTPLLAFIHYHKTRQTPSPQHPLNAIQLTTIHLIVIYPQAGTQSQAFSQAHKKHTFIGVVSLHVSRPGTNSTKHQTPYKDKTLFLVL